MIHISTRGRYALRSMVDIALQEGPTPVLRHDIAERQGMSADCAAQLFGYLRRAGLVEGVRGPGGGYRLARQAAAITVGDIITAVEGPIALVHCTMPGDEPLCARIDQCVAHLVWKRLSASIERLLNSVTLQDLRGEAQELAGREH
jgi:Rrf2 family protein